MVVTRRPINSPMPPASRTSSSQSTPRAKGAKQSLPSNGDTAGATVGSEPQGPQFSDDVDFVDPTSASHKRHHSSKLKNQGRAKRDRKERIKHSAAHRFVDLLARMFLLWFTIYTLTICPNDVNYESRVCRGLSEYRRLILEPFILPPIYAALDHPTVKPYVDTVKPHITHAVEIATPVVQRAKAEFDKHVVPRWNEQVVPLVLRLDHQFIRPYRERAYVEYEARLAPHMNVARYHLDQWQRKAQPYLVLAAIKTYNGFQFARPYMVVALSKAHESATYAAVTMNQARRKFIDPHVAKMLEKASELSTSDANTSASLPGNVTSAAVTFSSISSTVGSSTLAAETLSAASESMASSTVVAVSDATSADTPTSTSIGMEQLSSSAVSSIASVYSAASSSVSVSLESESAPSSSLSSAIQELSSSATSALSSIQETLLSASILASNAASSATFVSQGSVSVATPVASEASAASSSSAAGPTPPVSDDEDDIDLAAFYAELGISENIEPEEPVKAPASPPELTEEEKARLKLEREENTRKKREDVTSRHSAWEEQIKSLIKDKKKEFRKSLVVMRKSGAAYIKSSPEVRAELSKLEEDTNKFLSGAEAVLKSLVKDKKSEEEKIKNWNMVMEKVDERFTARLRQTEEYMHQIYMGYVGRELAELNKLHLDCKYFAQDAQANIGMDYAWLEDVTYQDWQRYHALVGMCNDFLELAKTVQNGTHPSPPVNPLIEAVTEFREEMSELVEGFEVRFSTIQREGTRAIEEAAKPRETQTPPKSEVSVLPIDNGVMENSADSVLIGRSAKEVEEAAARVLGVAPPVGLSEDSDEGTAVTEKAAQSTVPVHVEL